MAVDMFLKLGDIEGESKDSKHEKWIDVLSWSWGMTQSGTTHMGGGSGGGKVDVQDLGIVKYVDHATAALHRHCSTGKHIDTATFKIRKAGGDTPVEYVVIELKVIIVTSISQDRSGRPVRLAQASGQVRHSCYRRSWLAAGPS